MKVCVCGAQNVGKSTFIQDVIQAYPEFRTPSYTYRDAIKEHNLGNKINRNTNFEAQSIILTAVHKEVHHPENQKGYVIHDRSPIDVIAYSTWPYKYKKNETDITEAHLDHMTQMAHLDMEEFDLIIYIPVDDSIKIEEDNLRDTDPEYRYQMDEIFDSLLAYPIYSKIFDEWGYKVVTIQGSRKERVAKFNLYYSIWKGTHAQHQ